MIFDKVMVFKSSQTRKYCVGGGMKKSKRIELYKTQNL